jgi:hypothetical protein
LRIFPSSAFYLSGGALNEVNFAFKPMNSGRKDIFVHIVGMFQNLLLNF